MGCRLAAGGGDVTKESTTESALVRAWYAVGEWIGAHLMLVVPIMVAIGMLVPEALLPFKPYIPTFFALMTLQNSLTNDASAMVGALRRPGALTVIVLWVHVAAPALVWAAASLAFGADSATVAGVVLEYSVPIGTSTVMWIGLFQGDMALGLSALLVSACASPFTIPVALKLLVGATISFDTIGMMRSMAFMVAIPALIATVANALTHGRSARLARPTMPAARLLLPLIVGTNATSLADYVRHPTWQLAGILLFMLACAMASFLVGMAIARWLDRDNRSRFVATSFCCSIRNVSVGAVLATQYFGPEALFPAVITTPFQQVLAALFGKIMERRLGKE